MALQAKEFEAGSGKLLIQFPDLVGTGHSNKIIQKVLGISDGEFCILVEKYGAVIDPSVIKFVLFYWDNTDLTKCRKFKNWLNKEFRERKVSVKKAKLGEYNE